MKIAVVYLARSTNGSSKDFMSFAASYRKYNSGVEHDLVLIHKGAARRPGCREASRLMFEGGPLIEIERDDAGYDIHAYLDAAAQLDHDYICFFNTFSEIRADDWLLKLLEPHRRDPACGMTGTTASYESLYDSHLMLNRLIWLSATGKLRPDPIIASMTRDTLAAHAPTWLAASMTAPASSAALCSDDDLAQSVDQWRSVTLSTGPLAEHMLFKPFPNPHLRSNGWMIRRDLLCALDFRLGSTKIQCCHFESGSFGVPLLLAEQGFKQVLVGADGRAFEAETWPESDTFRLGDQANVMVSDNQVRVYDEADAPQRRFLRMCSWGDYAAPAPEALRKLGHRFPRGPLRLTSLKRHRPPRAAPVTISIVLPTRNRHDLLRQALGTIVRQDYQHWECCVFDNASDTPLDDVVKGFGDDRIRLARSDEFLPVTESWNRAVDMAAGDYVCLLGDDDGLTPMYMNSVSFIAVHHDRPDFIYNGLFQFFHPGVAPWEPSGEVKDLRDGEFFRDEPDIFLLDEMRARRSVAGSLQFRRRFAFNMQSFCFEKSFLDALRADGKVFHSPFPDYYLANVAFGMGKKITIAPKPIVVAGVSRKSFGFTLFNEEEARGAELLGTAFVQDPLYDAVKDTLLPGRRYVDNYLLTMAHVRHRLGAAAPVEIAFDRYRRLQLLYRVLPALSFGARAAAADQPLTFEPLDEALRAQLSEAELHWVDEIADNLARLDHEPAARVWLDAAIAQTQMYDSSAIATQLDIGGFSDLDQLYAALEAGEIGAVVMPIG